MRQLIVHQVEKKVISVSSLYWLVPSIYDVMDFLYYKIARIHHYIDGNVLCRGIFMIQWQTVDNLGG